jgi:hypothetical protein
MTTLSEQLFLSACSHFIHLRSRTSLTQNSIKKQGVFMRDILSIIGRTILSLAASIFALWLFALLVLFALGGCSKEGEKEETNEEPVHYKHELKDKEDEKKDKEPEPCTVEDIAGGAVIKCPDGSTVVINDGLNGQDGQDAPVCTFEVIQTCE